jgi:hypothetical protein
VQPVAIPQQRDCGVTETSDGLLKATVILQRNQMGIPGLVTSMDKIYEVSCDYRSVSGDKKTINSTTECEWSRSNTHSATWQN